MEEEYKIDRGGKPMPEPYNGRPPLYPFHDMEVGDTFDAPRDLGLTTGGSDRRQHILATAAKRHGDTYGKEFIVRCVDKQTVRCKRIA